LGYVLDSTGLAIHPRRFRRALAPAVVPSTAVRVSRSATTGALTTSESPWTAVP